VAAARRAGIVATLPYFFFGTLIDRDLLNLVCGGPVAPDQIESASISGYRRTGVCGRSYPILVPDPVSRTGGILVHGLDRVAAQRLDRYEGANYRLSPVKVLDSAGRTVEAAVFLFVGKLRSNRRHWRLSEWQRRWKRRAMRRAGRIVLGRG
jgi:hypothetical protein